MKVHSSEKGSGTSVRVLILLAFFLLSLIAAQSAAAFRNLKVDEIAPAFSLRTVDGGTVDYAAPPEVAVIIAFVKQGQEKSENVIKALNQLDPIFEEKVQPLAVLLNPEEGDAAKWVEDMGVQFPILLDNDQVVYALYGVMVAPEVAIVAPDGLFKHELSGYTSSFKDLLDSELRKVLGVEQKEDKSASVPDQLPEERKKAMREVAKAKMLIKRRMMSKALPQLKKALATDDTYVEAHVLIGGILVDEGGDENLAEAEKHFKRAAELDPKSQMIKVGLARLQAARGDTEGAIKILEKAAMISPKPAKLYYYLGQTHEKAGNLEGAIKAYKKALKKLLDH